MFVQHAINFVADHIFTFAIGSLLFYGTMLVGFAWASATAPQPKPIPVRIRRRSF